MSSCSPKKYPPPPPPLVDASERRAFSSSRGSHESPSTELRPEHGIHIIWPRITVGGDSRLLQDLVHASWGTACQGVWRFGPRRPTSSTRETFLTGPSRRWLRCKA